MGTLKEQTKRKSKKASTLASTNGNAKNKSDSIDKTKSFYSSVYPESVKLPEKFAKSVKNLEKLLAMPVWAVIQNGDGPWSSIDYQLFKCFQSNKNKIPKDKPMAILLESPGGDAHSAYRIGRMLQKHTNNRVTVIIPQFAKSAATLLALSAKHLIVGLDAELGPLDVQIFDRDRESVGSALDAVQSLERLNAFAMTAFDQTMMLLTQRIKKRTDVLLPEVFSYVSSFVRPLLEKIDTLDYTKKSRELKVAEEYAIRLMKPNYPWGDAKRIARQLVEKYPTHGFVIDSDESSANENVGQNEQFGLGLDISSSLENMEEIQMEMENIMPFLDQLTVIGLIGESKP